MLFILRSPFQTEAMSTTRNAGIIQDVQAEWTFLAVIDGLGDKRLRGRSCSVGRPVALRKIFVLVGFR